MKDALTIQNVDSDRIWDDPIHWFFAVLLEKELKVGCIWYFAQCHVYERPVMDAYNLTTKSLAYIVSLATILSSETQHSSNSKFSSVFL